MLKNKHNLGGKQARKTLGMQQLSVSVSGLFGRIILKLSSIPTPTVIMGVNSHIILSFAFLYIRHDNRKFIPFFIDKIGLNIANFIF